MNRRFCQRFSFLFLFLSVLVFPTAVSAVPLSKLLAKEIEIVLRDPIAPRVVLDRPIALENEILPRFYEERNYLPAWFDDHGLNSNARTLLEFLRASGEEGLCPEDYHLELIELLVNLEGDSRIYGFLFDPGYMAPLELLFTDAFISYSDHLLEGRLDPAEVHVGWRSRRREADRAKLLRAALEEDRLTQVLEGLFPPHAGYIKLKEALEEYRRVSALGGWPVIPDGPVLHPGDTDPRLPLLRTRLRMSGDLPPDATAEDERFDRDTAEALKRFQRRHGLRSDGVLGPQTLAKVNLPVEELIRRIEINLERWRWLPKSLGSRYILINIADFNLRVVEQNHTVMSMSVVVGTGYRKTPVFSAQMTYLEFAPYWVVPPTILREDKLPLIKRDPGWLGRHHYELLRNKGNELRPIDPLSVDWGRVEASVMPGVLRMQPGPWNPLGQVKFMFPNRFSVYLHDTPKRYLFDKDIRSYSSGCIRIERPLDLAQYLFTGDDRWNCATILAAMESATPVQAGLPEMIPVHILYWTAWVDEAEDLHFRDDIYQRDIDMFLALQQRQRPPFGI